MKNIIFIISLLFSMTLAFAQEINVPVVINKTFETQINAFKDCENIVWSKNENNYVATYDKKSIRNITSFSMEGRIVENLEKTDLETLSENVLNYIDENYPKAKVMQCFSQSSETAPNRSVVEIKLKGISYQLFFRPDGTFHYEVELK